MPHIFFVWVVVTDVQNKKHNLGDSIWRSTSNESCWILAWAISICALGVVRADLGSQLLRHQKFVGPHLCEGGCQLDPNIPDMDYTHDYDDIVARMLFRCKHVIKIPVMNADTGCACTV